MLRGTCPPLGVSSPEHPLKCVPSHAPTAPPLTALEHQDNGTEPLKLGCSGGAVRVEPHRLWIPRPAHQGQRDEWAPCLRGKSGLGGSPQGWESKEQAAFYSDPTRLRLLGGEKDCTQQPRLLPPVVSFCSSDFPWTIKSRNRALLRGRDRAHPTSHPPS